MDKTLKDLTPADIDLLMQVHRALVRNGYEATFADFLDAVIERGKAKPIKIEVVTPDMQKTASDWLIGGRYVQ